MASSDIIKIGFDYRASLAQFEKETNGVFDGISEKAGKQKIVIQLDAKNDKVIDKIKELQKLKLDKFTFEFGDSGIKEQLKTFGQLENKINEIINLSKGIGVDFSSTVSDVKNVTNAVDNMNKSFNSTNTSALQQEEKQIQKNIDSIKKLLDLKYEIKNVNKSSYSGKGNIDWIGIYKNQEEAIEKDLASNKNKLNSSLNLILSEDKNALSSLEEEAVRIKTSLKSVQDMSNRISSNSSINYLDKDKGSEDWYKGYAEAYKAIDDRLKELNSQYRLTNDELEEYITLQVKAEKIMDRMISHSGGVQVSGAKSKTELKNWIEKSFATDLGLNPEDIYNGLFGNITDALYSGNGISLFDSDGTKRNLREISAEILKYKSVTSPFDGSFGVDEDSKKLRELNSVLNYIKNNEKEIANTDFTSQIKEASNLVDFYNKKITENGNEDFYTYGLKEAKKDLDELISLQNRLDASKNIINSTESNITNQDQLQSKLKEAQAQIDNIIESENKLAETQKETFPPISNDSKFEELKSDITEVRQELDGVKEKISGIDSEGFESIKSDVERTTESVKELNSELTELKSKVSDTSIGNKSNISSGTQIKDVFQGDKIDQATTSAKELDKTLEQVNIPTDSFDEVLSKLDLAKSELGEIVKITKQSVSDSEGKFHDSYTLKDKRGSTEIYGLSSNTKKGQLLRSNIVGYDAKAEAQESKRLVEENIRLNKAYYDSKKQEEAEYQRLRAKYLAEGKAQEEKYYADLKKSRESTLKDYQKQIDSYRTQVANFEVKPDEGHSYDAWKTKIKELNSEIEKYQTKVNEVKNNGGIVDEKDEREIKDIQKSLENMVRTMSKTSAGERGWTDLGATKTAEKLNDILRQNPKMAKAAQDQIKAYYNEIRTGNPSAPLNEILNKCIKIEQKEREMGRAGKSWLDIFKEKKIYSFLGQAAGMFSFYDLVNVFRQGIDVVKEFDDGLTKISYTMDMTKSQFDGLGKSVLDMSNNLDSSISNAMQVAQIYANMNTSTEEIQKLSEPTLILSNLTGFDASTVADDIQAVTQQFNIAAEDSMHIADVYDQISRNISVDYSKGIESIAEAVQVAGSTADQAGLSFEQLAAIVGKTVEKTRLEGSQVGNGLKTIMTRLSKVGKLSEDVDNETLSQASESLHQIGVEVYNADGSFRQFDTIMGELANKWGVLTDAEKSNISFNIAATRQTNLLSAVLSNFSDSMQLAEDATNANGNALENNQKWVDSFGGHLQSLENTAQTAWINILNSNTLKNGVDVLNSILKIVVELIDKFGILGTVGAGAGIYKFVKNFA